MSDYLGSLVSRSLSLTQVVKPRLASTFEPPAIGWPLAALIAGPEMMAIDQALIDIQPDALSPDSRLSERPNTERAATSLALPDAKLEQQPDDLSAMAYRLPGLQQPSGRLPERPRRPGPAMTTVIGSQPGGTKHEQPSGQPNTLPAQPAVLQTPMATLQAMAAQPPAVTTPMQLVNQGLITHRQEAAQPRTVRTPAQTGPDKRSVSAAVNAERVSAAFPPATGQQSANEASKRPEAERPSPAGGQDQAGVAPRPSSDDLQSLPLPESVSRRALFDQPQAPATSLVEPASVQAIRPSLAMLVAMRSRLRPQLASFERVADETRAAPEPPPTIHVTIGRIEVRATLPTAPPQQQRTALPVMSLDDYLRQRAAGGNR